MKIFHIFSLTVILLTLGAFIPAPIFAATTFPVNSAGIGAYVKLKDFSVANFENAKQYFDSPQTASSTYVISFKKYHNADNTPYLNDITINFYLNSQGWLVAYLNKGDAPSRIVNWTSGVALENTMLKFALGEAMASIVATAETSMKYYDFSNPEANKMTLVREAAETHGTLSNNFSVLIPGTTLRASYAIKCLPCVIDSWRIPSRLYLDSAFVGKNDFYTGNFVYGDYFAAIFNDGQSHSISIEREGGGDHPAAATVFIYKTN